MILSELFNDIEKSKIKYFVYKGLSHLKEDLSLLRNNGDIDIYVANEDLNKIKLILFKRGYNRIQNSKNSFIKFFWNENLVSKIEIVTKIKLGKEPFKPYFLEIDYKKVSLKKKYNVIVLDDIDYFPLQFLIRILSKKDKDHSINEITNYYRNSSNKDKGYIGKMISDSFGLENTFIKNFVEEKGWIKNKLNIEKNLKNKLKYNKLRLLKSKIDYRLFNYILLLKKLLLSKSHGLFVVFQGVDGSGKSSTINFLIENNCLRNFGVKTIYFGSNKYWFPFLNRMICIKKKPKLLVWIVFVLSNFDRRMRVLKALLLKRLGFIVLGDRYFYDDLIGYSKGEKSNSKIKQFFRDLIRIRNFHSPDLVFFMDVSPQKGYERKQDYTYEILINNVKAYRDYFYNTKMKNLIVINSDQKQEIVKGKVLSIIKKKVDKKYN